MEACKVSVTLLVLFVIGTIAGCSGTSTKSPDVSDRIRSTLDQTGLKNVSITQDRDKGVVTLGGHVENNGDKFRAETVAKSLSDGQVVADQIAVVPHGIERDANTVNADLDEGIEKNLDAALIQNGFHENVKYGVKNGVATLTGQVNSQSKRAEAERVAASVPNVQQVVNELQVTDQKASSSH
jgi:hyperosmotically inducible periplasmic protein